MSHRYPLSPLFVVREIAREKADTEAARAAHACEQAELREAEVQERLNAVRESVVRERRTSLLEAERSPRKAHEFQLAEQRRLTVDWQIELLSRELNRAHAVTEQQRLLFMRAQESAVRARQELAAVERHRSRFNETLESASEANADEDAAENWLARRRLSKPGAT